MKKFLTMFLALIGIVCVFAGCKEVPIVIDLYGEDVLEYISGEGVYKEEDLITLTAQARAGYDFAGWIKNEEVVSTDLVYTFTASLETAGRYTVEYNLHDYIITNTNSDAIAIESTANYNEEVDVEVTIPTGYYIEELYYMPDGSDTKVNIVDNSFIMPAADISIFVSFAEIQYAVVLSPDSIENGAVALSQENATAGTEITVTATPNEGYKLTRLYYVIEGSYAEEDITSNTFAMPNGNVTLYAIFEELRTYTITFNSNHPDASCPVEAKEGSVVTVRFSSSSGESCDTYNIRIYSGEITYIQERDLFSDYTFIMPSTNIIVEVTRASPLPPS